MALTQDLYIGLVEFLEDLSSEAVHLLHIVADRQNRFARIDMRPHGRSTQLRRNYIQTLYEEQSRRRPYIETGTNDKSVSKIKANSIFTQSAI